MAENGGKAEVLRKRAAIIREMRRFFDEAGFVEVSTPVRLRAPAPEPHIDCPVCDKGTYLRASPELQMKKLLAAGLDLIYQIGPCFREGEIGSRHHPEFTMIEWYRKGADYLAIADDLEGLLPQLGVPWRAGEGGVFHRIKVRDAYSRYAGWDPWAEWNQDRFDFDMATKIEPALKELGGGVFLMDYPVQAASLARVRGDAAERWEFYLDGVELANCFTELCDGDEQRRRFEAAKAERKKLGESDYPLDEEFLALLPQIGSAAGVALGVDRLVAALIGIKTISGVMSWPEI